MAKSKSSFLIVPYLFTGCKKEDKDKENDLAASKSARNKPANVRGDKPRYVQSAFKVKYPLVKVPKL